MSVNNFESCCNSVADSTFCADLLVTIIGGFLGFGLALLLYYFQTKRDKKKEQQRIDTEFKDMLAYFKQQIDGVIDTITRQNTKSKEFVAKIRGNPTEVQALPIIASKELDRIHNSDSIKIFHAFRNTFKNKTTWVKDFNDLFHNLDYVDGNLKELMAGYNEYWKMVYEKQLRIKDIVDELPDYMTGCILELKKEDKENYTNDPRFAFLNAWILKYRELADGGQSIETFNQQFLGPLLKDTLDHYDIEFFGEPIMKMCKKARVLLNDIRMDSLRTSDDLERSQEQLEKSIEVLKQVSKKL